MKIIGISGKARAGKSTAADFLVKRGWTCISLADPLKRICAEVFQGKMTERHLWGDGRDEPIVELGGLTARKALQTLGTEWGRACYADVWIDYALAIVRRIAEEPGAFEYRAQTGLYRFRGEDMAFWGSAQQQVVIPDVRFKHEAAAIRKAGGEVWRIERPGLEGLNLEAAAHASENELPEVKGPTRRFYAVGGEYPWTGPHYNGGVIGNDGDLAKLERAVAFMLEGP